MYSLLKAHKESVYKKWYRDVSGTELSWSGPAATSLLTAASEQHGRPSAQQRVAPELGGGRQRWTAALCFGTDWTATLTVCNSGKNPKSLNTEKL